MFLKVNDVGDGNYIQLFNYDRDSLLTVDFGLKQQDKQNSQFIHSFLYSSQLLISHYHQDHYRGLMQLEDNSAHIERLYYPRIPDFTEADTLKKQILFLEFIQNMKLGSKSGSPAKDLVDLINKKNSIGFKRRALKQGDCIDVGDVTFDVVWPPEKVNAKTEKALSHAIKEINEKIDANAAIGKLWNNFDRNVNSVFSTEERYVEKNTEKIVDTGCSCPKEICISNEIRDMISDDEISSLSEMIRKITNRFSVCLYCHHKFLFLGDLESSEINHCIEFMKKEYQINHVNNLITAHHGTHWGDKLFDIYAKNIISSNGKKLVSHFEEKYEQIGNNIYSTYLNGNLTFDFNGYRIFYLAKYPY